MQCLCCPSDGCVGAWAWTKRAERDRGTQPGSGDIRLSGSGLQISGARGGDWGHPVPDSYAEATCAANITQLHPAWPGLCAPRLPGPQCTLGAQTRGKKQSVWPESGPGRLVCSTHPQCSAGPGHSALHQPTWPGQRKLAWFRVKSGHIQC